MLKGYASSGRMSIEIPTFLPGLCSMLKYSCSNDPSSFPLLMKCILIQLPFDCIFIIQCLKSDWPSSIIGFIHHESWLASSQKHSQPWNIARLVIYVTSFQPFNVCYLYIFCYCFILLIFYVALLGGGDLSVF